MSRRKRGYYTAPNSDIPLNNRDKGEVAPVAFDQLRPYQEAADQWPMHRATHGGTAEEGPSRLGMECRFCGQFIYFIEDEDGYPYQYVNDEPKTLTVAHIRRQHSEKVIINEQGHCEILVTPCSNDFGG
jgi:hypothetical protein